MPSIKLTVAFCGNVMVEPGNDRSIFWDSVVVGLGLQVTSNGHRSFVVQYRAGARGRTGTGRRMTLNGGITLDNAHREARATRMIVLAPQLRPKQSWTGASEWSLLAKIDPQQTGYFPSSRISQIPAPPINTPIRANMRGTEQGTCPPHPARPAKRKLIAVMAPSEKPVVISVIPTSNKRIFHRPATPGGQR